MNLILIFVGAVLVNNFVMNKFMGCCPVLGVSKKTDDLAAFLTDPACADRCV